MALMLAPTIWRFPCDVILIQIWCVCVRIYLSRVTTILFHRFDLSTFCCSRTVLANMIFNGPREDPALDPRYWLQSNAYVT